MNDKLSLPSLDAQALWSDLRVLCDTGGRLCGSDSEYQARLLLRRRLLEIAELGEGQVSTQSLLYPGWTCRTATIEPTHAGPRFCSALIGSPPTRQEGLAASVIDLGRGTESDFSAQANAIPGRIVLVRHEYMFAPEHIHRSRKYRWAQDYGAAGFLIASAQPGMGPVTGSCAMEGENAIPAAGIDFETATAISVIGSARLVIEIERVLAETENLILDLPGQSDERVVLSAHLDGHALASSALDNATGVVAVLAAARTLSSQVASWRRGLRLCLFSLEEWGLSGSARYLDEMSKQQRGGMVLNINLDSVAGSSKLTALTSGFGKLDDFLGNAAESVGIELDCYQPLMINSDHYNFAHHGIPALRLVAGFDQPDSNLKYVLTPGDTIEKIDRDELRTAAQLTTAIAARACTLEELDLRG